MSDKTRIAYLDATWNPTTGCTSVSAGCTNCWARRMAQRRLGAFRGNPDTGEGVLRQFDDVRYHEDRLSQPLRWWKPRRIGVSFMGDVFHEDVSDSFLDRVFAVMALRPQHQFFVLTKRPERMREYLSLFTRPAEISPQAMRYAAQHNISGWWVGEEHYLTNIAERWPLPNVWLGISCEDQTTANQRIPILLQTPAARRWISYEPALAPVDLRCLAPRDDWHTDALDCPDASRSLSWVVIGGESGPGARPCDVEWIRSVVAQCKAADVPCFVKQLGSVVCDRTAEEWPNPHRLGVPKWSYPDGLIRRQTLSRSGSDPAEWPADVRVQQRPVCGGDDESATSPL